MDRTIPINGHGQQFQASVGMVELQDLTNPNEKIVMGKKGIHYIRSLILNHSIADGNRIFLSVGKRSNFVCWQGTYILQEDS